VKQCIIFSFSFYFEIHNNFDDVGSQFFLTCEFSNEKLRENLISKLKDLSYSELLHNKTVKEDFQNFQGYLSSIGLTSQKSSAVSFFFLFFLFFF